MPPLRSCWSTALAYFVLTACGAISAGAPPAESPIIAAAAPEPGEATDSTAAESAAPSSDTDAGTSTASDDGGEAIRSAALKWLASNPDLCPSLEGLIREGLLIAGQDEDAWGRRYTVGCDDDGDVTVTSFGPDGEPLTADDVVTGP